MTDEADYPNGCYCNVTPLCGGGSTLIFWDIGWTVIAPQGMTCYQAIGDSPPGNMTITMSDWTVEPWSACVWSGGLADPPVERANLTPANPSVVVARQTSIQWWVILGMSAAGSIKITKT